MQTLFYHCGMISKLKKYCEARVAEFDKIPVTRQAELKQLSNYILSKNKVGEEVRLIVICTHNSRRSHMGQIWLSVAANYYQSPQIHTYSGGTEATAFNPNAVAALQKTGLNIEAKSPSEQNPVYAIQWQEEQKPYLAFSKKYSDSPNPTHDFAAIMVCTEADMGCPIVQGADFRLSLPYDDPKAFDKTDLEAEKYSERCAQIAREMLYVFRGLK